MREYKETDISGRQYTRCKGVQIINELGNPVRTILFHEEEVAVIGDKHLSTPLGAVLNNLTADNGHTEFDIIDFNTMQPTGQKATYNDAYALMASLYLHSAQKRDEEQALMVQQAEEARIAEEARQVAYAEEQRLAAEAEAKAIAAQAEAAAEAQRQAEEAQKAVAAAAEQQRVLAEQQEAERLRLEQEAAEAEAERQRQWEAKQAADQAAAAEEAAAERPGANDPAEGTDSAAPAA